MHPSPVLYGGMVGAASMSAVPWKEPHPALRPKSGLPDFGAKHVEFDSSRIRLGGEGEDMRPAVSPCNSPHRLYQPQTFAAPVADAGDDGLA